MSESLTDFLLARIAEEEAVAQAVPEVAPKSATDVFTSLHEPTGTVEMSPARVLADCEARRRIVEDFREREREIERAHDPDYNDDPWTVGYEAGLEATLRALALTYASHPSYREEWRP